MTARTTLIASTSAIVLGATVTPSGFETVSSIVLAAGVLGLATGVVQGVIEIVRENFRATAGVSKVPNGSKDSQVGDTFYDDAEETTFEVFWIGSSKHDDSLRFGAKPLQANGSVYWGGIENGHYLIDSESEEQVA